MAGENQQLWRAGLVLVPKRAKLSYLISTGIHIFDPSHKLNVCTCLPRFSQSCTWLGQQFQHWRSFTFQQQISTDHDTIQNCRYYTILLSKYNSAIYFARVGNLTCTSESIERFEYFFEWSSYSTYLIKSR